MQMMADAKPNLLRPDQLSGSSSAVPAPDERAAPAGYYFSIMLDAISVLVAGVFGFAYRRYIAGTGSPWLVIDILLLFGVLVGTQGLLLERGARRFWIIAGQVVAMGVFFYDFDVIFLAAAAFFSFAFFAAGYWDARREMQYTTEIRFFANTRGVIGKFITGILLFMVLLYVPQLTPQTAFISEGTFSSFFEWSANTVEQWYPGIPLAGTFGDFATALVARELKNNPEFAQLPPQSQGATVATNATAFVASFSQNLGVAIQATDTVSKVAYGFIIKTLTGWHNRFASVFLIGWSVVVFLILRSIGIIFTWIDQLFLGVVYEILLATRVAAVREEPATKETITFT
jgi:hypothetical protein